MQKEKVVTILIVILIVMWGILFVKLHDNQHENEVLLKEQVSQLEAKVEDLEKQNKEYEKKYDDLFNSYVDLSIRCGANE